MRKRTRIFLLIIVPLLAALLIYLLFSKPDIPGLETMSLQEWFRCPSPVKTDGMNHKIKVAATALQSMADKDSSVAQIIQMAEKIKREQPDVRLITFGEASTGLYHYPENPRRYQQSIAETIPGRVTDTLGDLARRLGVFISAGLIEKAGDTLYNSIVVVDPAGNIVARHRKSLLHYYDELNGVTAAENSASVFQIDHFKVGLSICADANSTWLVNNYREQQIDLLIYSVTSNVPWIIKQFRYWPVARKYNAWIVASNRFGREGKDDYTGLVFIADKKGAIDQKSDKTSGYITATIGKD